MEKIILASASPRRKDILNAVGIPFEVVKSDVDESGIEYRGNVGVYVQELALLKASAAAKKLVEKKKKNMLVISADTVVFSNNKILGKPKSKTDACSMLFELSGKTHEVVTGICVFRIDDAFCVCDSVTTRVSFKNLSEQQIEDYVATGEPMDKAGAYGIQGRGAVLCNRIEGDYFNIVGLPVSRLWDILKDEFNFNIDE